MSNDHYIGQKGYTLYKNKFDSNELRYIKSTLTVKPNTGVGIANNNDSFPVRVLRDPQNY